MNKELLPQFEKLLQSPPPGRASVLPRVPDKIVLYGAGSMGEMALDCMRKAEMCPAYLVDAYSGKKEINGIPVIHPDNVAELDKDEALFVVCIATLPYVPLKTYLTDLGCTKVCHFYDLSESDFPHIMPNGWLLDSVDSVFLLRVYAALAHDDFSAAHFLQFLWWRIARVEKINADFPVLSGMKYFKAPCIPPASEAEFLIDCGVHSGQTIESFKEYAGDNFAGVHGFEPDPGMYKIAQERFSASGINIEPLAVSDSVREASFRGGLDFASTLAVDGDIVVGTVNLDSLQGVKPTFIKIHVEGEELAVLRGARKLVEQYRPVLMVLADHSPDGVAGIPEFLMSLDGYRLYFYLHDYCGNSAIFYAVPE
ncbi:FkbM family methyltransferase [Maridesulfovibrio sp.]|uniref:FkbM family methyltransferase n=1 Tax=Maridesulfovibrio sp. TaxID=2795000 RepID=UPI0029F49490|nr:FkbM family methyltransferase [Maridesulfovibrio sp.]